jgi:CheY-like chemotaxis protein
MLKALYSTGSGNSALDRPLRGRRILVIEDQILIALSAQDMLRDAGADVVIATRTSEAAEYLSASPPFDGAVIDLNLGEGYDDSLVTIAIGRGIPVVFATGYGREESMSPAFADIPVALKPYTGHMLVSALRVAMGRVTGGG